MARDHLKNSRKCAHHRRESDGYCRRAAVVRCVYRAWCVIVACAGEGNNTHFRPLSVVRARRPFVHLSPERRPCGFAAHASIGLQTCSIIIIIVSMAPTGCTNSSRRQTGCVRPRRCTEYIFMCAAYCQNERICTWLH